MTDVPDLGPPPQRVAVPTDVVRRLVSDQFPQWASLPVQPVADGGWDNCTFHLGTEMSVRLPTASEYALAVAKEHRWLPLLAPQLPVPIPTLLGAGVPDAAYPHPWSVHSWLDGRRSTASRIAEPTVFASDLADFLLALRAVDPTDGPGPGIHNWFRGGTLRTFDANTSLALTALSDRLDINRVREVWADALAEPWDGVDTWFHGDMAEGNLLLDDTGQLSAVIDFGTCGVGDPACDLAVAWTLLTPAGREVFRERLAVDDSEWMRGRGWALWKAVATCRSTVEDPADAADFDEAARVVDAVCTG